MGTSPISLHFTAPQSCSGSPLVFSRIRRNLVKELISGNTIWTHKASIDGRRVATCVQQRATRSHLTALTALQTKKLCWSGSLESVWPWERASRLYFPPAFGKFTRTFEAAIKSLNHDRETTTYIKHSTSSYYPITN